MILNTVIPDRSEAHWHSNHLGVRHTRSVNQLVVRHTGKVYQIEVRRTGTVTIK